MEVVLREEERLNDQREELAIKLAKAQFDGDRGMVAYYQILIGLIDQDIEVLSVDSKSK